jgi:hypothetical protein
MRSMVEGGSIPMLGPLNRAEIHDNLFLNAHPLAAGLCCCGLFSMRGVVDPSGNGEESGACGLSLRNGQGAPGIEGRAGTLRPLLPSPDLRFRP